MDMTGHGTMTNIISQFVASLSVLVDLTDHRLQEGTNQTSSRCLTDLDLHCAWVLISLSSHLNRE